MSADSVTAKCAHCSASIEPNHSGPCPSCGQSAKLVHVINSGTVQSSGEMSWVRDRKAILRKRPWMRPTMLGFNAAAIIGGFFIAPPISAGIAVVLVLVSELWGPQTVERIIRTSSRNDSDQR